MYLFTSVYQECERQLNIDDLTVVIRSRGNQRRSLHEDDNSEITHVSLI